ncbi:L-threonylcarbamoyladenylate synthase [Eggerthellaceae bacterium 3-80]|nr:threonylcarbamoyl-AMP synthase [bacterium D16-34]
MQRPSLDAFGCALDALRAGQAVVFPTDTVFGLGVSVLHAQSSQVLYDIKKRDAGKPIAWLVRSVDDLSFYGHDVPPWARLLAAKFWPGDLTLVVRAAQSVPKAFRSEANTIGLRMPNSPCVLRLIEEVGSPLATTSANRSGAADVVAYEAIDPRIASQVSAIIPGWGSISQGVSSTVIDATTQTPHILRAGARAHLMRQELVQSGISF